MRDDPLQIKVLLSSIVNLSYRALIINWWLLMLIFWPDCVAISRDIVRHGSISNFWFMRKLLNLLILKLISEFQDLCNVFLHLGVLSIIARHWTMESSQEVGGVDTVFIGRNSFAQPA